MDNWLYGNSISELVPSLFTMIPKRLHRGQLVCDVIPNRTWISNIQEAMGALVIIEYVHIWRRLCLTVI